MIEALSLGPEAVALRAARATGVVRVVLRDVVYLESSGGYVVGIMAGTDDGPLTLRVHDLAPLHAALACPPALPFQATPDALYLGPALRIGWAHTPPWHPALPVATGDPAARAAARTRLGQAITQAGPPAGCAGLVPWLQAGGPSDVGMRHDPLLRRVAAAITASQAAAQAGQPAAAAAALTRLLGLGPGLTPSGDDLLMGLLAAWVWQRPGGRPAPGLVEAAIAAVGAAAPQQTNQISTRLLAHASRGILAAPALALGAAVLGGDPAAVAAATPRLFTIGHTSGVDLTTGLLLAILDFGFWILD
ncbi:MAG TPA: DUF2877 domain-containing protein [Chloroflexia bacterium]|nr:DUF2877 domain-containing protein [Chloroflexia bacterium]